MADSPVSISLEFTPNPNTLKFVVNRSFLEKGAANFLSAASAADSPLATRLFGVSGVQAVMVGTNFVTITKSLQGSWDALADDIPKALQAHFQAGEAAFTAQWLREQENKRSQTPDTEVEKKIRDILDSEIRPAVAMDGGDIVFERFENGTVYLHLQGACSSCPSSIMTLKMGVETRLKEAIPEIVEVVQV